MAKVATVVFILCGVVGFSHSVFAIGITPPEIDASAILRGTSQEKTLTIVKDGPSVNEDFEYTTEVRSDYKDIIDIAPSFEIPAGKQTVAVPFTIRAQDLPNGDYSAVILFYQSKKDSGDTSDSTQSAQLKVVTGIAAKIQFSVSGDQTIGYEISSLQAQTTETDKPVHLNFTVNNIGNVGWRPQKVQLVFQDQLDSENTVLYTVNEADVPLTGAGEQQDIGIDVKPNAIAGEYKVTADFYYGDKVVQTLESQPFHIYPSGTLAQAGTLLDVRTNKQTYTPGENIKLEADFQNTGDIRTAATLTTEISRETTLLDLRKADPLDIDAGDTQTLADIFSLDKPGKYTLAVSVSYGSKKTITKNIQIDVVSTNTFFTSPAGQLIVVGAIILLIVIVIIVLRKRREHHEHRAVQHEHTQK